MKRSINGWWFTAVLALAFCAWGCPSFTTMQTVDTVPEGKVRFGVGLEALGVHTSVVESTSGGEVETTSDVFVAPQFEINVRYGIIENLDIGAKIYPIGGEFGAKYQFLDGNFDMAIAPALAYSFITGGDATIHFLYVHLPLLMDYDISESFAIAFGPKFMFQAVFGEAEVTDSDGDTSTFSDSGSALFGGAYIGFPIKIGSSFWIIPEFNYMGMLFAADNDTLDPFEFGFFQGGLMFLFGGAEDEGPPDESAASLAQYF